MAAWVSNLVFFGFFAPLMLVLLYYVLVDLPRTIDWRRLRRFRLQTLLLWATVIQIGLAGGMWSSGHGGSMAVGFAIAGFACIVAWLIWWAVDDVFRSTSSRRWKSAVRPRRVHLPQAGSQRGSRAGDNDPHGKREQTHG